MLSFGALRKLIVQFQNNFHVISSNSSETPPMGLTIGNSLSIILLSPLRPKTNKKITVRMKMSSFI